MQNVAARPALATDTVTCEMRIGRCWWRTRFFLGGWGGSWGAAQGQEAFRGESVPFWGVRVQRLISSNPMTGGWGLNVIPEVVSGEQVWPKFYPRAEAGSKLPSSLEAFSWGSLLGSSTRAGRKQGFGVSRGRE